MAVKKTGAAKAAPAAAPEVAPAKKGSFFKKAQENKANAKKKPPAGTIIKLPAVFETVNGERRLTEESLRLNDAINRLIEAKADADAAENKANIAKTDLRGYVEGRYAGLIADEGMLPKTPIQIINVDGQDVTYVIQDRTNSTGLSDPQIEMLAALIGEDRVKGLIRETEVYSLDAGIMNQPAGEIPAGASMDDILAMPKVGDVVAELFDEVLSNDDRLTQEQKEKLFTCVAKKFLASGTLERVTEHVGRDVHRVSQFFDILGSAVPRYFKP